TRRSLATLEGSWIASWSWRRGCSTARARFCWPPQRHPSTSSPVTRTGESASRRRCAAGSDGGARMTQTAHPPRTETRGLAARVSLGRLFTPPSTEFVMIASTAVLLTIFGVVMVLSATSASPTAPLEGALKQGLFALVGIPLMFVVSRLPIVFFGRIAWPALIVAVMFQLLVFVPGLGVSSYGNRNWINIAGIQLQPSEFLKLALAIWIAFVLMRKQAKLGTWHQVFIPVVPVAVLAIGTVIAGNDLGTVMVLVLVVLGCLFFSGAKLRLFILPLLLGFAAVLGFALTSENR